MHLEPYIWRCKFFLENEKWSIQEGLHFLVPSHSGRFFIAYQGGFSFPSDYTSLKEFAASFDSRGIRDIYHNLADECSIMVFDSQEGILYLLASGLGLFPVYYRFENNILEVSSNLSAFFSQGVSLDLDALFLSTVLNFPVKGATFLKGVKRVEGGMFYIFNQKGNYQKTVRPRHSIYGKNGKASRLDIFDAFQAAISRNLVERKNLNISSALTGGFDSRSGLAALLAHGINPSTYTFGSEEAPDIRFADKISRSLGLKHHKFLLNDKFYQGQFKKSLQDSIQNGNGLFTYNRVHYYFAFQGLVNEGIDTILTGNGGSELFRMVKSPGIHLPRILFLMAQEKTTNLEELVDNELNRNRIADLIPLNRTDKSELLFQALSKFHKKIEIGRYSLLYQFIFDETMHAWYGTEMTLAKSIGLNTFSPYLDPNFIDVVLLSQNNLNNNKINTKNPFTKARGQKVYSQLIENSGIRKLCKEPSSKGYSPFDLLKWYRYPLIVKGKLKNKLKGPVIEFNSNMTREAFIKEFMNISAAKVFSDINFGKVEMSQLNSYEKRRLESLMSTILWYQYNNEKL